MNDTPYIGNYVHSLYAEYNGYVDCIILTSDVSIRCRSEVRRVGEECGVMCRSGWSPHY